MFLFMVFAAIVAVTQLAILGAWGRSVRWTTLLQGIVVGFLVCGLGVGALQFAWTRAFSLISHIPVAEVQSFASWAIDPWIEEIVKVAPLVLLAWLVPRVQRQLGWTDHLLAGAALGMGFELLEAGVRFARLSGLAMDVGGKLIVDGSLAGVITVPWPWQALATWLPAPTGFEGLFSDSTSTPQHLAWTALAAIGVAWLVRWRGGIRLLGLVPLLLVSLDHVNYNLRVQLPPPLTGWWSDALAWLDTQLSLVVTLALVVSVIADRVIQARGRRVSPEVLLADESPDGLRPSPVARVMASGLPLSAWVTWRVVLSRRAAMTALTAGEPEPRLRAGVARAIDVLRRVSALPAESARTAWRDTVRQLRAGLSLRRLRSPWMIVWALAALPAFVYLVVGGFPATVGVQQAMRSPVGLWILGIALAVGVVLTAVQVRPMIRALQAVTDPSLHEARLRWQARLSTAIASLAASVVLLAAALVVHDPGATLVRTYHLLDALSDLLIVAGLALMIAAFFLFPPVALVELVGGGFVLVATPVAATFAQTLIAGVAIGILGEQVGTMEMSGGRGDGGGAGTGGDPPPRYTSNRDGRTRTFARSMPQLRGKVNDWTRRMERRGYTVTEPPLREGRYQGPDITVVATRGGDVQIRHFILLPK